MAVKDIHDSWEERVCDFQEKCRFFNDAELPILVLVVSYEYALSPVREWRYIAHQTGGHACHHYYMIGTILKPRPHVIEAMKVIDEYWLDTDCGMGWVELNQILTYRRQLNELFGVDCNISYPDFEEGIYPIDCSVEIVRKLVLDEIPDKLDDFIIFEKNRLGWLGCINRWDLYILGHNCD